MNPHKNIEKLLTELTLPTNEAADKRVLNDAMAAYEKSEKIDSAVYWPSIGRKIMKSTITKLAAAAVIIIAAGLGIVLLDKSVKPAYAIEDTIKALENIYSINMSGTISDKDEGELCEDNFVLWAKPNEDGTGSKELRLESSNQIIIVDSSAKTYFYDPKANTVLIKDYENFHIQPWIGSKFFHIIKKYSENWQVTYGRDEANGRESIFATCQYSPESKSWWFEFDAETKLPVRFKQWTNMNSTGKPEFSAESIEYNPKLPEGIFEFKIPQGAKVEQVSQKLPNYLNDPNCGMNIEDLTDEQASETIVRDYLQALIDGDWQYLSQLRPICNAEKWELKYKRNESWPVEVIEIGKPIQEDGCNIGPIVPCTVKYSDGQIKTIKLIIKIRNLNGNKSCVIAGTYGGIKDFER